MPVEAGEVIEEAAVTWRELPRSAIPREGLAGPEAVGSRAAVVLPEGAVLLESMVARGAGKVAEGERVVEIPVKVGAQLAAPGARVDLIGGSVSRSWGESAGTGSVEGEDGGRVLCAGARVISVTPPSGGRGGLLGSSSRDGGTGTMVTLVAIAVPEALAADIVWAATQDALGLALSP